MKNIESLIGLIIIVCLAVLIVLSEIAYFCVLRVRDKIEDCIAEL